MRVVFRSGNQGTIIVSTNGMLKFLFIALPFSLGISFYGFGSVQICSIEQCVFSFADLANAIFVSGRV